VVKVACTAMCRAGTRRHARSCPPARAARRTAALASRPVRAFPRPPLPEAGSTPRRLEVLPCHVSRLPSPVGHAAMDRRSVPCPCAHTYQDEVVLRSILVGPLVTRLAVRRLFKAAMPPHARAYAGHFREPAIAPPWPPTASFPLHAIGRPFVHTLATTTFHHSLQSRGLPGRADLLAGDVVPATAAALRLPPSSLEPPRLLLRPQTSHWWSQGPPSAPPWPDSGEPLPDLGPDRRRPPRGTQLQGGFLFEGRIAKQGPIRKESQTFRGFFDT
jgi:hypothetical protein